MYIFYYYILAKQKPSAAFPSPSGGAPGLVVVKEKRKKIGVPDFRNFCRAMRIPNMCLVLKLDNGKVVTMADEQTDGEKPPTNTTQTRETATIGGATVGLRGCRLRRR